MSIDRRSILVLLFVASCAHNPQAATSGVRVPIIDGLGKPLVARIEVRESGQTRTLAANERLSAKQDFGLRITTKADRYVYVLRTSSSGGSERLFPPTGEKDVRLPAGTHRIPPGESWLRLSQLSSTDNVCVLLSEAPMTPDEQNCPNVRVDTDPAPPEPEPERKSPTPSDPPPPSDSKGPPPPPPLPQ